MNNFAEKYILSLEFQFELFSLNLGKLSSYVQYFSSYNIEGVAESWMMAEMSWVEVGGAEWWWVELGGGGWS